MIKPSKKLALLPAFLLLALCLPVIQYGISDIKAYPVRYAVNNWQSENRLPVHEELSKTQQAVNKALKWDDKNPEYYDYQGLLFHYQALITKDSKLKYSALNAAAESYRHSLKLRPNWPYSWANLALTKAFLAEIDQEFKDSIKQAANLGPWENGVNIALTEAGLLGWLRLSKQERIIIIGNIQRGIRRNMEPIKFIINRYNKRSLVCANLQRDIYQSKLCGF